MEQTLASEMLSELKASNRRWFIAFIVVLVLWFATIGVFIWYISLPIEEITVDQYTDGDANTMIGVGDNYGYSTENNETETGEENS